MGSVPQKLSIYDQIKTHLDALDLIRRLGLTLVRTLGSEAYCRPLCHESSSGESLQVNIHTGVWNCKACQDSGYHGDLIQLVEYALSNGGAPTHGVAQRGSTSHREAIEWLCGQYGIPFKLNEAREDPALEVVHLFAVHAHEYLLSRPDVIEWIGQRWGFDLATISSYSIGFVPSPITPAIAAEAAQSQSKAAFKSSGIGWYEGADFRTRFEGRVIFPYLEHGRAVYLIGRATEFTPALPEGKRPPKYHKLSVHSPDRKWISSAITNDHLYNEKVLRNTDRVVVAEGIADAVALSSLGVPVVSPVTISFNATDLERFVRKVQEQSISRVEILFDNELSGSGNHGARETGKKLVEHGLTVSILTLPLGPKQVAARNEVLSALGDEVFTEFEAAKPRRRKEIIEGAFEDGAMRQWLKRQVAASKIDAAEWVAEAGAGAAGRLDRIRKDGRDVVELEIEHDAIDIDPEADPADRLDHFADAAVLAAHVDEALLRGQYAGLIAKLAGKGVTKAAAVQRISRARKTIVRPKRKEAGEKTKEEKRVERPDLQLPPPVSGHARPEAPEAPEDADSASGDPCKPTEGLSPAGEGAAAPPAPQEEESEHDRLSNARRAVLSSVEAKIPEETVSEYVAQVLLRSMGFTPFLTPDDLFLVRGNERIAVGLHRRSPEFGSLIYMAAGLTSQKASHRSYIDVAIYFLRKSAKKAADVSWSYVDGSGRVYFPTGDVEGNLLRIERGKLSETRMADVQVPAVAGRDFRPINYTRAGGGIEDAMDALEWVALPKPQRMILLYWVACLPLLRKIGTVPIVRIEGGSSSGKSRSVDAISFLVNGGKSSSVPTAAALISRLASEMLTIDDNREVEGVDKTFRGTLLQATQLGAREKRRGKTDTGTVIERVAGALLMNGVEPIHSGQSEVASRMLVMRCDAVLKVGSPSSNETVFDRILGVRDRFWSDALRRCSIALELDKDHGERIGSEIEELFGETRIGRLSAYLRMMYFVAVAGLSADEQDAALRRVLPTWADAFSSLGRFALDSLVREELAVSAVRYAFDYARATAEVQGAYSSKRVGCNGKYQSDDAAGDESLGPMSAPQLARLVRVAGKEMNAPRAVTSDLRAGQLEARILDGVGFLESAGIHVQVEQTNKGKIRFSFYRALQSAEPAPAPGEGTESWTDPDAVLP